MASNDLLSQDEIDALLHGVDSGEVASESDDITDEYGIRAYDFATQDRIVRGRLPTLEMINERFARYFRTTLFNMIRRSADISVSGVQMLKFSEFVHSLFVPTSLNIIKIQPLRGKGLCVIDPKLVFTVVDTYFGGTGRFLTKIEGREFTPTEIRVVQMLLEMAFRDLVLAWKPILAVDFEYVGSEINPQFANIASPSEVVVVNSFHVDLEQGGGDLHIALPYFMIEPIRDLLDAGVQSDRGERDERWEKAIKEDVMEAQVDLKGTLTKIQLSVQELSNIKPGDVIPVDIPELVEVLAADVPVFRGKIGISEGCYAIKIAARIEHKHHEARDDPFR